MLGRLNEAGTHHVKGVPWSKGVEIFDAIGVASDVIAIRRTGQLFSVCATNARRKEAKGEEARRRH